MGLIEEIRYKIMSFIAIRSQIIKGNKLQKLNKPIEEMSNSEKAELISSIIARLDENNPNFSEQVDRIFQIIDTIPQKVQMKINVNDLRYYYNSKLSNKFIEDFEKRLTLSYKPKFMLKYYLFRMNLLPYAEYYSEIVDKIISELDISEIKVLTKFNSERNEIIKLLYEKNVDISEIIDGLPLYERVKLYDIENKGSEEFMQFFEKYISSKLSENNSDYIYDYDSYISSALRKGKISYSDKIFLDVCKNKRYSRYSYYSDEINEDIYIEFLVKYGTRVIEYEKKYNNDFLWYITKSYIYSQEKSLLDFDLGSLLDKVESIPEIKVQEDLINKFENIINRINDEIKTYKQEEIKINSAINKYSSLQHEEKMEFLESIEDVEEIKLILSYYNIKDIFKYELRNLSEEKVIEFAKKYTSNPIPLLCENINISREKMLDLFNNKEITMSNYYLFDSFQFFERSKLDLSKIEETTFSFDLIDIYKLYNFDEPNSYQIFLENIFEKLLKQENNTNEKEELQIIGNVIDKYTEKNNYKIREKVRKKYQIENLTEFIKKNYDRAKYIEWSIYDFEELVELQKHLPDLKDLDLYIISKPIKNKEITMKCIKDLLHSLSEKELKENYFNRPIDGTILANIYDAIIDENITKEELLKLLSKEAIREKFAYEMIYGEDNNKKTYLNKIFDKIDPGGLLKALYESINDKELENLIFNGGVLYLDDNVRILQNKFLTNILAIEKNKDKLFELLETNPNLLYTCNFELLNLNNIKYVSYFSKYVDIREMKLENLKYSNDKLEEISELLSKRLVHPEKEIYKALKFCSKISSEEIAKRCWETFSIDDILFMINEKKLLFYDSSVKIDNEMIDILKETLDIERKKCDDTINNPDASLDEVLNAYTYRFFKTNLSSTRERIESFGTEVETIISKYEAKDELSDEEKIELYSLKYLKFIKEIINTDDIQLLKELYKEFDNDPIFQNVDYLSNVMMLEENLKSAYNKEKNENLYIPSNENSNVSTTSYNGKEINVYNPKGDFNMLITVVGAYIKNSKIDDAPYKDWNDSNKNVNQNICTSIICNDNLSMAINKNELKFGFINIESNSIEKEAPYDLSSNSNSIVPYVWEKVQFRTLKGIKDNVRTGHSEHLLQRDITDNNGNITRRQPDYIIAINKITKRDKKAAADFNIPIVYLDTKEISKSESEKIRKLKEKIHISFEENDNINIDDLSELVLKYHNNYAGMFNLDKKSLKKYFNPTKMKDDLETIAKRIMEIKDKKTKKELQQKFIDIIKMEEDKRKDVDERYIPFEFDSIKNILKIEEKNNQGKVLHNMLEQYVVELKEEGVVNKTQLESQMQKFLGEKNNER